MPRKGHDKSGPSNAGGASAATGRSERSSRKSAGKQPDAPSSIDESPKGDASRAGRNIPIVGVGASAGGLEAFSDLLRHLPARTGMAFVFVQHLDPTHGSMLRDLLARASLMPVEEAQHGRTVEPNRVYVIRPNTDLSLDGGILKVAPRTEVRGQHMPVDFFFRALAKDQGSYAIGVVLSGTASDGAQGLAAIKAEGGITFAQDEKSAKYGGMPHAAVSTGGVDFVLPPDEIARELARIAGDPEALRTDRPAAPAEEDEALAPILTILRKATGIDLSYYKRPNLLRRIQRRCLLQQVNGLTEYVQYLREHPTEVAALHHDILINVTSFFRDDQALEGLTEHVFPALVRERPADSPIRIWVPGCATGEEPYTLAIALVEFLEQASANVPIQIFATDVSERAIENARAGAYLEAIAADVSPERLRRFFIKVDRGYQVSKRIRDLCVFAKHNLVTDPPFSQLDLVSCCNVLIYLRQEYQRRVMELFHYALRPNGFLKLGRSETIGASPELFTVADKTHKIYAKKLVAARMPPTFTARVPTPPARGDQAGTPVATVAWGLADLQNAADRLVLGKYAPPGVLINEDMTIVQFRGRTGPFLEPAPGDATLNVLKMARETLVLELRTAVHQSRRENRAVRKDGLTTTYGGQVHNFSLEVIPIDSPASTGRHFLVLFDETPGGAEPSRHRRGRPQAAPAKTRSEQRELTRLRAELATSKEHLQAIIEELEAANEELKSANEETLSSNEELQSTNEELETAKEELQSINEELTTVNEQLQVRNVELSQLANDLSNLLSSVNMPIVMVSSDLRIRRATPAATRVLNLLPADVGRPITDLTLELGVPDLRNMLVEVIDSVAVREFDVRDRSGRRYVLRIQPYRTHENKIDGAVMVLLDVDELKRSVEAAEAAKETLRRVQEITDAALSDLPLDALLEEVLVRVRDSLGVDTATMLLREEGEGHHPDFLRARAAVGLDEEVQSGIRVPIGQGFAGTIAAERKAIVLEDVDYDKVVSPWIRMKGIRSMAGVPLPTDGRLIGVLHVGSLQRRRFQQDEVHLLRLASDRIALAIERAAARDLERRGREAAEEANRAKDEFLTVLSHELRTPLNATLTWLNVIKRAPSPEQIARAVETMERNIFQQARLIRDLLDVSRIVSGKLELDAEQLDMAEIVGACVQELRPSAESKSVILEAKEVGCPCIVRGDASRLRQLVENLLSNALKFTPAGGRIEVSTSRDERIVTIIVADSGEGIESDFLPYVFDRFRQADNSSTRHHGGLGLGLAIVRHLVERHGGTIEARSAGRGHGSTFTVRLPLDTKEATPMPARGQAPDYRRGDLDLSVMLVDDDVDTCEGLAIALDETGAQVRVARSVTEALAIDAVTPMRIVISDISMPGSDGYALIRTIRERDAERGTRTIAIAMTGLAGREDRDKAIDAGFDEHVAKPIEPSALIGKLRALTRA